MSKRLYAATSNQLLQLADELAMISWQVHVLEYQLQLTTLAPPNKPKPIFSKKQRMPTIIFQPPKTKPIEPIGYQLVSKYIFSGSQEKEPEEIPPPPPFPSIEEMQQLVRDIQNTIFEKQQRFLTLFAIIV